MKEKIYLWLTILNIVLFSISLSFYFQSYFVSFFWLFLLMIITYSVREKKDEWISIFINSMIFLLAPIGFFHWIWLTILIPLIYFLLPIFLSYEKITNKQLNVFIMFMLIIWITIFFISQYFNFLGYFPFLYLFLYICSFVWLSCFFLKRKFKIYWIMLLYVFLFCMSIYLNQDYFSINPLIITETKFDFNPFIIAFVYLPLIIPSILTTFSLLYVKLSETEDLKERH